MTRSNRNIIVTNGPQGSTGSKGAKGDQGYQGISGPQGFQGSQGNQGVAGAQGYQGVQGSQGNIGSQGDIGVQGDIGTQGNQGNQGVLGSQGVPGVQGSTGITGNQGTTGAKGDQGFQGFKGNTGNTGSQGTTGNTGPKGDQGFQGNTGAKGDQGFQGVKGTTGNTGSTGAQGNQGDQGEKGTTGNTGGTGAQGATGSQGATGAKGDQGFQGFKGNTGNTGSQGTTGNTGPKGDQGFQGNTGAKGDQGFQGVKGTTGNTGFQGAQGTQGFQGVDGNSIGHNHSGIYQPKVSNRWVGISDGADDCWVQIGDDNPAQFGHTFGSQLTAYGDKVANNMLFDIGGVNALYGLAVNGVNVVLANDSRLTDSRTPLTHTHSYLPLSGGTLTGTVGGNDASFRRYFQSANGQPTNNLGSPTLAEMALFDTQFNNKTAFYDISKIKFFTSPDDAVWTEYTGFSDTEKRKFVGGDSNSGIFIPNGSVYFRIEIISSSYCYLNALYMYFSSNSHNTTVKIRKKNCLSQNWIQHTDSSATVSSWPGHLYLPFGSIPFHPGSGSDVHYDTVHIDFKPNYSTGTSSHRDLNLYQLQLWGGYPAARRVLQFTDENKNVTFPARVSATDFQIAGSPVLTEGNFVPGNYPQFIGAQGLQGVTGNTGAKGDQGFQGLKGTTGNTGSTGAQGYQGVTGGSGGTGPQGPRGYQGLKGTSGNTGSTGAQGYQGVTGGSGGTGPQGPQGVQGAKGNTGNTGSTGAQGASGSTGAQGVRGYQGFQGDGAQLSDNVVTYAKIANDLTDLTGISASDIDWDSAGIFGKSLTANITFTFSGVQLNKVITVILTGDYTVTLPSYCKVISGEYDGSVTNYLQFHCASTVADGGAITAWVTISQES